MKQSGQAVAKGLVLTIPVLLFAILGCGSKPVPRCDCTLIKSGTDRDLKAVTFVSPTEGWIVGDGGVILHTVDGGQSFVRVKSGTEQDLTDVSFMDSTHGAISAWTHGGGDAGVLVTDDGGQTWKTVRLGKGGVLFGVRYFNGVLVLAGRYGNVLIWTDDGGSWTRVQGLDRREDFRTVVRVGDGALVAGDHGTLMFVGPDGDYRMWPSLQMGLADSLSPSIGHIYDADINSDSFGVMVGGGHGISWYFTTADGGVTWHKDVVQLNVEQRAVLLQAPDTIWLSGWKPRYFSDGGVLKRSDDGGKSWIELGYGSESVILDMASNGADDIVMVGNDGLVLRVDAGRVEPGLKSSN